MVKIQPNLLNRAYLNGEWVSGASGKLIQVSDPATELIIGSVPDLGYQETLNTIDCAFEAFQRWRLVPALERSKILIKIASLCRANLTGLSSLLTLEQGKPLTQARAEIEYGASYFEWFAEEGRRIGGDIIPSTTSDKRLFVVKEPVGVCAAITPWNFPNAMIARKAAAALAAGCSIVVKPAPETPLSALALAQIGHEAGLPPGVFNVITGQAEPIAKAFMDSMIVRKISFTGSTEVGKLLMRQSADTLKRLTLELGGNAPYIVFDDADIELAASEAIHSKFRNSGQTCICANRFLVHRKVKDRFVALLVEASRKLKVGPGSLEDTDVGPLISSTAKENVLALLHEAVRRGASLHCGELKMDKGLFVSPAVLSEISVDMRIWKEEIFGPIAACAFFDTEEEAIAMANDSRHGLAAYIYTRDLARTFRVSESLAYGMIGVNNAAISSVEVPFGGVKESGYGREGGRCGIEEYLVSKLLSIGGITPL